MDSVVLNRDIGGVVEELRRQRVDAENSIREIERDLKMSSCRHFGFERRAHNAIEHYKSVIEMCNRNLLQLESEAKNNADSTEGNSSS